MSKRKRSKSGHAAVKKKHVPDRSSQSIISSWWTWFRSRPVLSCAVILAVAMCIFFSEAVFGGKTYFTPDAQTAAFMTEKLKEHLWTRGIVPQWMPYLFCGMPSAGSLTYNPFSYFPGTILSAIRRLIPIQLMVIFILHYVFAGLGIYLFIRRKGGGFLPGLFGALGYTFMPYMIAMTVYGHGSQMMTAAYLPWVLYCVDRLFSRTSLINIALYALVTGLMLQRGHVQVAYYGLLLTGFYALFEVVRLVTQKDYPSVVRKLGAYIGSTLLAFAFAAVIFLPLHEYTPFSIRGASSVLSSGSSQQGTGVDFDYATQWSFSPGEMLTFIIPSYYGFGGHTYWGSMPFTDYPNYMGIVILGLALYGFIRKVPLYRFLGSTVLIALLISFGRHFPALYGAMYDHFPYFNKFRVPVMILLVVECCIALLAGLGLEALIRTMISTKESGSRHLHKRGRTLLIAIGIILLVLVVLTLFQNALKTTMSKHYPDRYPPRIQSSLDEMRFDMFMKDLWFVAIIVCMAMLGIVMAQYRKISIPSMALFLVVVSGVDLWIVDSRVEIEPTPVSEQRRLMKKDDLIEFLESDSTHYRIDPAAHLFRETKWAAHGIQSVGGYHAAKPRRYQDFLESSGLENGLMNDYFRVVEQDGQQMLAVIPHEQIPISRRKSVLQLLDLLNVKYIVSPYPIDEPTWEERTRVSVDLPQGSTALRIYENTSVLPRAFFVGTYEIVVDARKRLQRLISGGFDPHTSVILQTEPGISTIPDSSAEVSIISSDIHGMKLSTRTSHSQMLVFSETFYPPGWNAYIDGMKTRIYAANHCFSAICVPAGVHEIEFRYRSSALWVGLILSGGALATCVIFISIGRRREAVIDTMPGNIDPVDR